MQARGAMLVSALVGCAFASKLSAQSLPSWVHLEQRIPSDPVANGYFGASIACEGTTVVVGRPYSDTGHPTEGAVYVFEERGATWSQATKLVPSTANAGDGFGSALDISGDTLVVGAQSDSSVSSDNGAAFVFVRTGANWIEQARLGPPTPAVGQYFGTRVAIDGDTIAVRTITYAPGGVYLFTRSGTTWTLAQALPLPLGGQNGGLVLSAATLMVGLSIPEQVWVFERQGGSWVQTQTLLPGVPGNQAFGSAIALDGTRAVLGAAVSGVNGFLAGAAYVFDLNGGAWSQSAELHPNDAGPLKFFGTGVALDGERLVIGAPGGTPTGAAYVFDHVGASWVQLAKLSDSDPAVARLGTAVAVQGDVIYAGAAETESPPGFAFGGLVDAFLVTDDPVGAPFCFGDGSGNACPCGNASAAGGGRGCRNSLDVGALLTALGTTSVAAADLSFVASSAPSAHTALLFSGSQPVSGGLGLVFHDGLKCVGVGLRRHGVASTSGLGFASWSAIASSANGWTAGTTVRFQVLYRDGPPSTCGTGLNTTNALEITFTP